MILYLDASALVKRYIAESGSDLVAAAMHDADGWAICRVGYVETARAIGLAAGKQAVNSFAREWPAFTIIEIDQTLVEHAATLALANDLRSIDALHLAACLLLPKPSRTLITWDRRLHAAARNARVAVTPDVVG